MAGISDVLLMITGDSAGAMKAIGEVDGGLKGMEESHNSLMGTLGKVALVGVAALGTIAIASVKMAGDFQTGLTTLVTGAGESESNIKKVGDGILAMAVKTGTSTKSLVDGMYMIESAGFHGAEGLRVLESAAEGAKVGNANLGAVANAVTSALNSYHLPATKAADVTNTLIATVANGKMHMDDLAHALGTVLGPAQVAGVSLAEVGAAMGTMTMQGIGADQASTFLRQTLISLAAPKQAAVDAFAAIGMKAHDVSLGIRKEPDGFISTMRDINVHLDQKFPLAAATARDEFAKVKAGTETMDEALAHLASNTSPEYVSAVKAISGGSKTMMGELLLTGANVQALQGNFENITKAVKDGGGAITGWDLVQKDFNFKLDQLKQIVETTAIKLGTMLLPALSEAADWLGQRIPAAVATAQGWFSAHQDSIRDLASTLGHDLVIAFTVARDLFGVVWPIIQGGFEWLIDHHALVEAFLIMLAVRFVAIKTLDMASHILQLASAFSVMAGEQGGIRATMAVLGMGGSGGLGGALRGVGTEIETFGGRAVAAEAAIGRVGVQAKATGTLLEQSLASAARNTAAETEALTTKTGALGGLFAGGLGAAAAIAGVAAVGVALYALATDAGGVRTTIKNAIWGMDQEQAYAEAATKIAALGDKLSNAIVGGGQALREGATAAFGAIIEATMKASDNMSNYAGVVASLNAVWPQIQSGGVTAMNALWDLAATDQTKFGALGDAATAAADKMTQGFVQSAVAGTTSYGAADAQIKSLMDDMRSHHRNATDAMWEQWRVMSESMVRDHEAANTQYISHYDSLKSRFAADAAAMGTLDKAGQAEYVQRHLQAYLDVTPGAVQALQNIKDQAQALHISTGEVQAYGVDTVANMLRAKLAVVTNKDEYALLKDLIQRTTGETGAFADAQKTAADRAESIYGVWSRFTTKLAEAKGLFGQIAQNVAAANMGPQLPPGINPGPTRGFADGGAPPVNEWALVGERGPELVKFGSTATVIPSLQSMQMLGGRGGGLTFHQNNTIIGGPAEIEAAIARNNAELVATLRTS